MKAWKMTMKAIKLCIIAYASGSETGEFPLGAKMSFFCEGIWKSFIIIKCKNTRIIEFRLKFRGKCACMLDRRGNDHK